MFITTSFQSISYHRLESPDILSGDVIAFFHFLPVAIKLKFLLLYCSLPKKATDNIKGFVTFESFHRSDEKA